MQIIGIDCASDPRNMGFARGRVRDFHCQLETSVAGTTSEKNIDLVATWLASGDPTLLCIDAPLGWPVALGNGIHGHTAGSEIPAEPNMMFRRETDREIKRRINKQPLDVGADRIARTAHAALRFLGALRQHSSLLLNLAWSPHELTGAMAIEVYPAATLVAHGFRSQGYKAKGDTNERLEIVEQLKLALELPPNQEQLLKSADVLDACVCILAGYDFLRGLAAPPDNLQLARREGWIWTRTP